MTTIGTCRLYRPDPTSIGVDERWGRASVTVDRTPESLVVAVHGEIDASNCARLADYVERHATIAGTLVIDTSGVDFFGAPAMAVLHRVDHCCEGSGVRWRLVAGPALRRVMRACGTTGLPQADNVPSALLQLGSAQTSLLR
jgi:anti-anti-sigma factor